MYSRLIRIYLGHITAGSIRSPKLSKPDTCTEGALVQPRILSKNQCSLLPCVLPYLTENCTHQDRIRTKYRDHIDIGYGTLSIDRKFILSTSSILYDTMGRLLPTAVVLLVTAFGLSSDVFARVGGVGVLLASPRYACFFSRRTWAVRSSKLNSGECFTP